ncbi:fibroblast growth factor receptor 4-like [Ruditapes philippinarum]|uniref:fibroblast growth factor receptor 4-like n=1 Tax=Ruditapes philippinarum TaxID=129788 RepID=UPI00295A8FE6|nr:fibroblast growth factor receptor 4-like [Ruditapes philippinarum]XP_060557456.1 fibroblast growth factor receptor 4-like [Ruditapes philippinarum]
MRLRQHSLAVVVVLASICLIQTHANKKPEWKEGAGALTGSPFISQIEGTEVKLSCPAKGRPKPELIWYKDDSAFFPRTDKIRMKGTNLKFMDLKVKDQGNYTCVAQNVAGSIEFTYVLEVMEKIWPLEANVSSNMTVYEGEDARFFCIVTNDETAKIQWLRIERDETIGDRPQHTFLQGVNESPEILILHDVVPADAGQYMCLIGNKYGSKYLHMYLTVLELTTTTTSTTTTTPTTTTTTTTTSTTSTTTTTTTTTTTPTTTTTLPSTTTTFERMITERITERPEKKKKDKKKKDKKRKDKKKKDKKKKDKKKKDRQREKEKDKVLYEDPSYYNELDLTPTGFDNSYPFDKGNILVYSGCLCMFTREKADLGVEGGRGQRHFCIKHFNADEIN